MDSADDQDRYVPEKQLEGVELATQHNGFPPRAREAQHAKQGSSRRETKRHSSPARQAEPPGPYQVFADRLRDAMKRNNLNASEVARRVWGTSKDRRGYTVARNRDRIGHYLSGRSYPEPENLQKLAEAVGLTIEELAMPETVVHLEGRVSARSQASGITVQVQQVPDHAGVKRVRVRGHIDRVIELNRVQELLDLISDPVPAEDTASPQDPVPGTVINGGR